VALILGDNIFYGANFFEEAAETFAVGGLIFACYVGNPERYGVVEMDTSGRPVSIVEKPKEPKSQFVVTGLYIFDSNVISKAKKLKPSARGELEITDINNSYLAEKNLKVVLLERGTAWLDMGSHESLLEAGNFIETIEKRQGLKIGCIEEIALHKKYIDKRTFLGLIKELGENSYRQYLEALSKEVDE
jgi:glucose-1-phosphate thymidylyltransferase